MVSESGKTDQNAWAFGVNLCWLLITFTLINFMIVSVGFRLMQAAEVAHVGEDSLLNELKEGVIIIDEKTSKVSFANTVA